MLIKNGGYRIMWKEVATAYEQDWTGSEQGSRVKWWAFV